MLHGPIKLTQSRVRPTIIEFPDRSRLGHLLEAIEVLLRGARVPANSLHVTSESHRKRNVGANQFRARAQLGFASNARRKSASEVAQSRLRVASRAASEQYASAQLGSSSSALEA